MLYKEVIEKFEQSEQIDEIINSDTQSICVSGLTGSSTAIAIGSVAKKSGGVHVVVLDSKDEAGYFYNDLTSFWDNHKIFYFPSGYKRSIIYGESKPAGVVQRNNLLAHIQEGIAKNSYTIICTYAEAIIEKTLTKKELSSNSATLYLGEKYSIDFIEELLKSMDFQKVDFVYEPGQFSIRGGIIDIFSYSDNKPYRIDMFGNEIDSIRTFDINTQLSVEKANKISIFPELSHKKEDSQRWIWFDQLLSECDIPNPTYWINSGDNFTKIVKDLRVKLMKDESAMKDYVADYRTIVNSLSKRKIITLRETFKEPELDPVKEIKFNTSPQMMFNKNFELLADFFEKNIEKGFKNYILTENQNQIERLLTIFVSLGKKDTLFKNIPASIHEGFTDNSAKISLLTDHQIFERHHRYTVSSDLPKAEALTVSELTSLSIGDYIVHIDHGVGRFGGLVKSMEGGKINEAVKLTYGSGDILLVNVHSLHKISKYCDKDCAANPKINKLGHGAWQKLKATTKSKVKDIVDDLIKLYAKRRQSQGFAFSPDGYLQNELEASFMYEDTPDQQKATEAFKADMEQRIPMDRLVCGDVGFGKTEIAIRAAFKAVTDGKQVAVLVPTTILSLQHFRTFSQRLKEFPVTIEALSRSKTAKETAEITERTKKGEVDILIGTHKILSKNIIFKDLGLLIIDEEQKFGVSSKEKLRYMRENIDTLTLTATPIPRTLQFSLMGARDLSIISTPPPNRQPVTTEVHVFNPTLIKEAIEYEIGRGGQVYFVHNRVDTISHIASLVEQLVPNARIAVGHGQMKSDQLEKVITDFIYGEYDILIATTIIESGIDISNANTMIINNAQNFGLSDLHQLRGRVGRTNRKAYCYLLTPPEETISETGRRRLRAIEDFSELGSGFNIAMQDLDIRGAGNLLGGEQSGFISDIGFETYQKILNEAIIEYREEHKDIEFNDSNTPNCSSIEYISDCQVEIAEEAFIPDNYVSNVNEKIQLYRKIDNLQEREAAELLKISLVDRFGALPTVVGNLFDVVEIRRYAIFLGFEKIIIKNGFLIIHFIYNSVSPYYDSERFKRLMQYIDTAPKNYKLKHKTTMLLLSIGSVKGVADAKEQIKKMVDVVK
ncbi:MAG: transcription-repair coupling factor [Rikenellaceae bacterium]